MLTVQNEHNRGAPAEWDSSPMPAADPIDDAALTELAELAVPTVTAALAKLGFDYTYAAGIQPMAPPTGGRMVGRARTLRFIQLREDLVRAQYADLASSPHRSALESVEPGEVMVIDARGCRQAAVVGDIFTRRVQALGGRGIVIDGVCRDIDAIRGVGLPLYARGVHGQGIDRRLMSVGSQEPVQIANVAVIPGDVVLGDADGVVVLPPQAVRGVIDEAAAHEDMEVWIRQEISAGRASLHTHYPPTPAVLAEFEAWMRAQGREPPARKFRL